MMSNPTTKRPRPLSPNIQIYRPQLTSVLSIAQSDHRRHFERRAPLCWSSG